MAHMKYFLLMTRSIFFAKSTVIMLAVVCMKNLAVPKRPLSAQTIEALRMAIYEGSLGPNLPPERDLAEQMDVSRPVLRDALATLEHEGLIVLRGRRRSVNTSNPTHIASNNIASVRLLSRHPLSMFDNKHIHLATFMSSWLLTHDLEFRIEVSSASFENAPQYQLAELLKRSPRSLWLLYRSTQVMQRWFQDHQIPCIVLGGLYGEITLPSIDRDYYALCRHAAGILRARGYPSVLVFCRDRILPGDQRSMKGFEGGWHRNNTIDTHSFRYATHDGSPESIVRVARSLWRSKNCPKAWFIFGSRHVITLLAWMASEGIRPGKDLHLISRDSAPYFESILGGIAHYRHNMEQFNKGLKRLVSRGIDGNPPKRLKPCIIDSDFVDGSSLGS
jgi:DNA-binding LacI/PurR family transcriptional regulator/DNA-binding transcriptional regulator YhcF (GntR family)